MRYSKYLAMAFCSFALMSAQAIPQEAAQPSVVLKPVKKRYLRGSNSQGDPTMALTPGAGNDNLDFSRCISDWDAATHMTKQEWRAACRRALSDYPGAFRY
jgi:predicted DNA-binding protein (MmcQ/YjbR family)